MFHGSIPALVTPFKDGAIDEAAFTAFVDWQITSGSSALVPCGTTGESATLTIDEHNRVIALTVAAARGRVPVIAGCGSNDTATALIHMRHAKAVGAAAALVVCPYYNKPSQAGLIAHFSALADGCDLPIVIYNIPGRSVVDMSVETMAALAKLQGIVGVKDATGNLGRVSAQRAACGEDFCQLSGEDHTVLAFLASGGVGCISVTGNIAPRLLSGMHIAWQEGRVADAMATQNRLVPLHDALFSEASPAPVKFGVSLLGHGTDRVRLPLATCSDGGRARVRAAMTEVGLLN